MRFLDPEPAKSKDLYKLNSQKPRHPAIKYFLTIGMLIMLMFAIYSPFYNGDHDAILPPYQSPFIIFFSFCLAWFSRHELFPYRISNPKPDEMESAALYQTQKIALPICTMIILSLCIWCSMGAAYDIPHPETKRDWLSVGLTLAALFPLMTHVLAEWITPIIKEGDGIDILKPTSEEDRKKQKEFASHKRIPILLWIQIFLAITAVLSAIANIIFADDIMGLSWQNWYERSFPAIALFGISAVSPMSRGFMSFGLHNPYYDEFEVATLNRSRHISLWIIIALTSLLCLWSGLGAAYKFVHPQTALDWFSIATMLLILAPILPYIIAEWIIPLPPEGEEE